MASSSSSSTSSSSEESSALTGHVCWVEGLQKGDMKKIAFKPLNNSYKGLPSERRLLDMRGNDGSEPSEHSSRKRADGTVVMTMSVSGR